ncbi:leukocyte immunoglobulin-like receptor subfamily A member 3, partial [Simochromis diagramma]|uniref:leukocyte immunoglobulin-like receptor subfamily A member 3 n=1 Tax=Simochromis diagramma TaxID=43689 RepID=UPI001A7EE571
MGHSLLCLLGLFLLSTVRHGNTEDLGVKATLTADRLTIPAGGSVTLTCDVKNSADFQYVWFREPHFNSEKTAVAGESKRELVTSDAGIYSCRGHKGTNSVTEESNSVTIQETGHGVKITVTANSTTIPAGGSVTLTCDVKNSADFGYVWFSEPSLNSNQKTTVAGESKRELVISKGGIYSCRGRIKGTNLLTEESDPVIIQETVSNRITVTLQHSWSQIFTGETITLRCEIQGGEGKVWKYEWTAPNTNSPPTSSEYRISRVSVSHSGDYRCRGSSDYLLTGWSDAFTLTVSSSKPRATLTAQSSVIPAGGSVTLSCSVEGSAGWKFDWFRRDSVSSKAQLMRGNEANRVISVSQGGLYHCRGGRGDPVYYTEDSSDVTVVETFPSKPTVTLQPSWTQIYSGETVTVRCEI